MKKKRLFGILLSLALMLTMMPTLAFATDAEDVSKTEMPENNSADVEDIYVQGNVPLFVGGISVNENMDTIPGACKEGNASVVFNEEKTEATLTLTNATIENYTIQDQDKCNIFSRGIDLNIVLEGNNKVDSGTGPKATAQSADYAIDVRASSGQGGKLTIEGPGSLAVNGIKFAIYTDKDFETKNSKITATSTSNEAISGMAGVGINGGEITAESERNDAIYAVGDIKIVNAIVKATSGEDCAILANGTYNVSIDNSEVEATSGNSLDYGIEAGVDITVNESKVTVNKNKASGMVGPALWAYDGKIDIIDSIMDESKGNILANKVLTIRNSIVKTEAGTDVLRGAEGVKIDYTGSGKYSTRVEATATGEVADGLSTNYYYPDVAVCAKADKLIIGSNLAITEPKGGTIGKYKVGGDYVIDTVKDGSKCASHVVIEVAKPAPTPAPVANPLTVNTTAKTTTRATTIKWTWNAVDGAQKYKVAYHKVGSKKWKVKTTKKTKYVLKGQKIKGLYEYKVAAVTASGDVWSDTSCRYFKTVKARAKFSKGALKVSWKKDKGAAGYEVFIARNKKMDGAQVIQVAADSNSYSVAGLENGRYYVKVRPMKNYNGVTYTGILCKARKVKVK